MVFVIILITKTIFFKIIIKKMTQALDWYFFYH